MHHQDVAQSEPISTLESRGFFPKQLDDKKGQETTGKNTLSISTLMCTSNSKGSAVSFTTQQSMLLQREINSMIRNPAPMIANVCVAAALALIFGIIFFGVGRQDRTDFLASQFCRISVGSSTKGQTTH
jgi:hypothetical protein